MTSNLHTALIGLLPRLRRFGFILTGSVQDAEELVQAACEQVLARAEQRHDKSRLDAWAYSLMRAIWSGEVQRREKHRHEDLHTVANIPGDDGDKTMNGILTLAAVRSALTFLPVDQRIILVLICVDGLSYQEAADILGIPLGTALSRIARGRENLRRRLEQMEGSDMIFAPNPFKPLP